MRWILCYFWSVACCLLRYLFECHARIFQEPTGFFSSPLILPNVQDEFCSQDVPGNVTAPESSWFRPTSTTVFSSLASNETVWRHIPVFLRVLKWFWVPCNRKLVSSSVDDDGKIKVRKNIPLLSWTCDRATHSRNERY